MKSRLWVVLVCGFLLLVSVTVEAMHLKSADNVVHANIRAAAEHVGSKCPKCQGSMEQGVMLGNPGGVGVGEPTYWVQGPLQRRSLFAGVEPKDKHQVFAFRCSNCGYLELFAK